MDDLIALRHSSARANTGAQRLLRHAARGKPKRLKLNRDMRADDAFRAILSDCLSAASAQASVLKAGRSVEALHHLRVALRRLEVMLGAFGKAFSLDWFGDLRSRAKAISARLGPARDLDVFLEDLWPEATRDGGDFAPLRRAAEDARAVAWEGVEFCLVSEDFSHFLDDIAALSQSRLPMGDDRSIRRVARTLLQKAAARVKKRGNPIEGGIQEDYLRGLSEAYTRYFYDYTESPLLIVNSERLNFVDSPEHLDLLVERMNAMRGGREFFNRA